jgi:hypothetical protein
MEKWRDGLSLTFSSFIFFYPLGFLCCGGGIGETSSRLSKLLVFMQQEMFSCVCCIDWRGEKKRRRRGNICASVYLRSYGQARK